jgi:hypothetical protein
MHIHKKFSAGRDAAMCAFCVRNKHKDCLKKEWDPWEPAATYSISRCGCVCEGRIGREYDSLRELAEHLTMKLAESKQKERHQTMLASRSAGVADEVLELIRAFDNDVRDDEGNFMVPSRAGHVDETIDRFMERMNEIGGRAQALIGEIAGSPTAEDVQDEMVGQLFNDTDDQKVKAEEKRKPFWHKRPGDEFPTVQQPDAGWPVDG